MNGYEALTTRGRNRNPIRVGLIGAGKFGSMFLSQVKSTPGLVVKAIADLEPERARSVCAAVGWDDSLVCQTRFTDDAVAMIADDDIDVVVEATGQPAAGILHARTAFAAGKHVVMVNVEADVLAGPLLALEADAAGVIYSLAYGDQPALTCELVDWARSCGFAVIAAGKGTKYLPAYHKSTPDTVWDHYGMTADQARTAGMQAQMFNSFIDGTKSAIEMAAIANATGLDPEPGGLVFPPCGVGELAQILRPQADGGVLSGKGRVEVVSSLHRDGTPVSDDLRWGVYVVVEAPNDYTATSFSQYGLQTDESGRYAAMYRPFHLIGLELNISIMSIVLNGQPTGVARGWTADVAATAKRNLSVGAMLDGEGGYTVYGTLLPAALAQERAILPIGLAHGVVLSEEVQAGQVITRSQVVLDDADEAVRARAAMTTFLM